MVDAGSVHFFFDAPFFKKSAFDSLYEPHHEIIILMDERERNIGDGFGRSLLDFFKINFRIVVSSCETPHLLRAGVIIAPSAKIMSDEKIFIVGLELVHAAASHIHEFDFHLS